MANNTTGGFLNYWLERVFRGNVRQSTYMTYRGYITNHLTEAIDAVEIAELRTERFQGFIATLQRKDSQPRAFARLCSC
jgi:hypothetical protein